MFLVYRSARIQSLIKTGKYRLNQTLTSVIMKGSTCFGICPPLSKWNNKNLKTVKQLINFSCNKKLDPGNTSNTIALDIYANKIDTKVCKLSKEEMLENKLTCKDKLYSRKLCLFGVSQSRLEQLALPVKNASYQELLCNGYHTTAGLVSSDKDKFKNARTKPPWRVLFFGTDSISLSTLKALHGNMTSTGELVDSLEVVTVQSMGKKQVPVKRFATTCALPIYEWPVTSLEIEKRFDLGILVSFGHLIPESVIKLFPFGIINVHPSLLPRWRGASPIFHTVLNGDTQTGVSITELRPKHFDVGPLLMQKCVQVGPVMTTGDLTTQLADLGAAMILQCLKDLPYLERMEDDQDEIRVTYAHKVDPMTAGCVNWGKQTASAIYSQYKALQGYGKSRLISHLQNGETVTFTEMINPELTTKIDKKDIVYKWGDFIMAEPGCIALQRKDQWLLVKCQDGMVGFSKVVIRSKMTASTFYYGFCNHKHVQMRFKSEENHLNKNIHHKRVPN